MIEVFVNNFILIVLIIGFFILSNNELKIESGKNKIVRLLLILVIIFTVSSISEEYFSNLPYYNIPRVILSFINYSLRPFIIVLFISLVVKERKKELKVLYLLAIINCIIYTTCFFSHLTFWFDSTNSFHRGVLGYSCHIVCLIYLFNMINIIIARWKRHSALHTVLLIFTTISVVSAAILDMLEYHTNIFDPTMLVCILLYYLYIYMEYTKIDQLTGLYNRKKLFNDFENSSKISAVISIDMNNLKGINDTQGHNAGDLALSAIGEIFKYRGKKDTIFYRVGGDEFVGLCFNKDENTVKSIIKTLKDDLSKTPYTCSFGYKMKDYEDILETYKIADNNMYIEKRRYHRKKEKEKTS